NSRSKKPPLSSPSAGLAAACAAGWLFLLSLPQAASTSVAATRIPCHRMVLKERLVAAVAERLVVRLLAAAEPHRLALLRPIGPWRQPGALVQAVEEGLRLAAPASAPEIGLAGLDIHLERGLLSDHCFFHHPLPSPQAVCYCPGSRTVVNAPPPHKARSMLLPP